VNPEQTPRAERDFESAMGWIARLRSDSVSNADNQAFALWLAEDPARRGIMDRALDLWDDLGCLRHLPHYLDENAYPPIE
jgi:transmembrane sensor